MTVQLVMRVILSTNATMVYYQDYEEINYEIYRDVATRVDTFNCTQKNLLPACLFNRDNCVTIYEYLSIGIVESTVHGLYKYVIYSTYKSLF